MSAVHIVFNHDICEFEVSIFVIIGEEHVCSGTYHVCSRVVIGCEREAGVVFAALLYSCGIRRYVARVGGVLRVAVEHTMWISAHAVFVHDPRAVFLSWDGHGVGARCAGIVVYGNADKSVGVVLAHVVHGSDASHAVLAPCACHLFGHHFPQECRQFAVNFALVVSCCDPSLVFRRGITFEVCFSCQLEWHLHTGLQLVVESLLNSLAIHFKADGVGWHRFAEVGESPSADGDVAISVVSAVEVEEQSHRGWHPCKDVVDEQPRLVF